MRNLLNMFNLINALIICSIVIVAVIVYLMDDLLSQIIAMAVLGAFIAIEFLVLGAPDVAIAEGAVSSVLTPVIFVVALRKVTKIKKEEKK